MYIRFWLRWALGVSFRFFIVRGLWVIGDSLNVVALVVVLDGFTFEVFRWLVGWASVFLVV